MVTELLGSADRERARHLVEAQGLRFHAGFDRLVGVFEDDDLVATGALTGDVLQMIAVAPSAQGGPALGEVVGELVRLGVEAGRAALFVYTKPEHAGSFERLGFALLAAHGRAALLEHGGGFAAWLRRWQGIARDGDGGAVVVNCNPFTLGHRWLLEEASRRVDTLYVLVVREDRSSFPFEARLRLVREGTRDLRNVEVLDTGPYAVSAVTFPSYFLKRPEDASEVQMDLDLVLFGSRIAPALGVRRRFVGTEPYCATTRAYNEAMRRVLPALGVEVVELARRETAGEAISASRVREALARGDLAALERLVPATTLAYLTSSEGEAVRRRLLAGAGRH